MHARIRPIAAGLALAFALAGCGAGKGDEDEVKQTVNGVYDALARKDAEKVCDSLSKAGKQKAMKGAAKGQSCEKVFKLGLSFAGDAFRDANRAEVTRVRVDGNKATASVKYKQEAGKVDLLKEDGSWKLNEIGSGRAG